MTRNDASKLWPKDDISIKNQLTVRQEDTTHIKLRKATSYCNDTMNNDLPGHTMIEGKQI